MKTRKPRSSATPGSTRAAGFTLVELLVVISIILLLAMLLMPTVQTYITQVYLAKSATMIRSLHDGAMVYKERNKRFPGEIKDPVMGDIRQKMYSGQLTGSQVLAACLFNIEYKDLNSTIGSHDIDASKTYAKYKPEYLIDYEGKKNSLSDGFPPDKAMPILYYLSSNSLAQRNKPDQFEYRHNAVYLKNQSSVRPPTRSHLISWVQARATSTSRVLNDGQFILIAAGLNRMYIVADVENPANPEQMIQEVDSDDIANDYGGSNE